MIREELRRLLAAIGRFEAHDDDDDQGYASAFAVARDALVTTACELGDALRALVGDDEDTPEGDDGTP